MAAKNSLRTNKPSIIKRRTRYNHNKQKPVVAEFVMVSSSSQLSLSSLATALPDLESASSSSSSSSFYRRKSLNMSLKRRSHFQNKAYSCLNLYLQDSYDSVDDERSSGDHDTTTTSLRRTSPSSSFSISPTAVHQEQQEASSSSSDSSSMSWGFFIDHEDAPSNE